MSGRPVEIREGGAAALPGVRLTLACRDLGAFLAKHAPRLRAKGVLVTTERLRPVGTGVRLKIVLLDGALAYSGEAVVTSHEERPPLQGMRLLLRGPIPGDLPPGPARQPAKEAPSRPGGADTVSLVDSLFADLGSELSADGPRETLDTAAAQPAATASAPAIDGARRERGEMRAEALGQRPDESASPGGESRWFADLAPASQPLAEVVEYPEQPPSGPETTVAAFPRRAGLRWMVVAAAALGTVLAVAFLAVDAHEREVRLVAEIRAADVCLMSGRLAEPRGDSALEHLLAAKAVRAGDGRVMGRLEVLAEKCADLGARALRRGDLEEAAAHYGAALQAAPGRDSVRKLLEQIEKRRRGGWSAPDGL